MGGPTRLDIKLAKDNSPSFQMPLFPAFLDALLKFSSVAPRNWAGISSMLVQKVNEMQIKSLDAQVCVIEKHKLGQWKMKEVKIEKSGSRLVENFHWMLLKSVLFDGLINSWWKTVHLQNNFK